MLNLAVRNRVYGHVLHTCSTATITCVLPRAWRDKRKNGRGEIRYAVKLKNANHMIFSMVQKRKINLFFCTLKSDKSAYLNFTFVVFTYF